MQEIKCPNCGEVIQVDESDYAQIVQQVRDKEFEKELTRREQEMASKRETELQLIRIEQEKERASAVTKKELELADKDREIANLRAKLDASETEKKLAVAEAVNAVEKKLSDKVNLTTVDALSLAKEAGNTKAVNVVLIGVMAKNTDIKYEVWVDVIKNTVPEKFLEANLKAFDLGYNL